MSEASGNCDVDAGSQSLSGLWAELDVGDVLFEGMVAKQSEILGRWNSRFVRVVRIRQTSIVVLYWVSRGAFQERPHEPRGIFDGSRALIEVERDSLAVTVRHFSDVLREGDCFGPRQDMGVNIRVNSVEDLDSLANALQGAGCDQGGAAVGSIALQFNTAVTPYSHERPPRRLESSSSSSATEASKTSSSTSTATISATNSTPAPAGTHRGPANSMHGVNRLEQEYCLLGELGRGAFSIVYRSKRRPIPTKFRRDVQSELAVKVVLLNKMSTRERKTQLRYLNSEVSVMRKVAERMPRNKNVVHLYESFAESRPTYRVCLVMELCNGGELFDRIVARRSFTERDAKVVIQKLASALSEMHSIGVVHRDIKPENLIYATREEDSDIKITDFGLAMDMDYPERDVYKSHVVGTSGYFAPEVLSLRYSPACDVWSLGVVLYILLCGYPPFVGRTRIDVQKEIREGRYEFHVPEWDNISDQAKNLISLMIEVNVKRRIRMCDVLKHPWITSRTPEDAAPIALDKHKQFNNRRKLKAAAYAVMWGARLNNKRKDKLEAIAKSLKPEGFTSDDLKLIRTTFDNHTKEHDGVIENVGQLDQIMLELGFSGVPVERMFHLFDDNGDGKVDQAELLSGLAALQGPGLESLKFCFSVYDKDGSGGLDKDELMSVLSMAVTNTSVDADRVALDLSEAFEQVDADRDGTITFDEFKSACESKPYLVECLLSRKLSGADAPTKLAHADSTASKDVNGISQA